MVLQAFKRECILLRLLIIRGQDVLQVRVPVIVVMWWLLRLMVVVVVRCIFEFGRCSLLLVIMLVLVEGCRNAWVEVEPMLESLFK